MLSKSLISVLALTSAVSASPALRRETQSNDNCLAKTNACRTTRGPDGVSANQAQCSAEDAACKGACYATLIKCQTTRGADGLSANQATCIGQYADCLGENPIASTGGIISSFIPYTATASSSAAAATTYACNPAHAYPGGQQCVSTNGALTLVSPTTLKTSSAAAATTYACNPAHAYPGGQQCISTNGALTLVTPTSTKASSAAVSAAAPGSNPKKVDGATWTLNDVIRYCGDNSNTCDYNFDIVANGKTEHCTIVNASKHSFSDQKCANGDYTVSWGYVANPAPAFAVITVVDAKNELAWFGASNVDSQRTWGNLGPEQVYTYN